MSWCEVRRGGLAKRNPPLLEMRLSVVISADYALPLIPPRASDMHRGADAADIAEHAQIAIDLGLDAGRLFRIVRQLHRRPAVHRGHLADDRDRIEIGGAVGRAADEIVGEVGAPAEADADTALEMAIGLLDRIHVH